MTKALTTEQLKALRDALKSWQDGYDPVDDQEQYQMFVSAESAVSELLVNREAQPVGFYTTVSGKSGVIWHNGAPDDDTAIYTTPPAPAVPDESDPRDAFESVFQMPQYVVRCGAGYAVTAYSAWGAHDFKERWVGWNACRAAMLAQPVSQGCNWIACGEQLPAVGETVLVSSDGYVSVGELERSGANYRYFTSVATGRELTVTHWMPLPAAPEGGNG